MYSIKRTNMPEIKPQRSMQVLPGLMVLACSVLMAPVADAAKPKVAISKPAAAIEGSTVNLNGSGTDADSDNLSFTWIQTKIKPGTPTVTIENATAAAASFKAPVIVRTNTPTKPLSLSFELSVNDGTATVKKSVAVTVKPDANKLPVADAGVTRTVNWDAAASGVTLDGSKSKDEDGNIVKRQWKLLTKKAQLPKKAVIKLTNANTENASFTLTSPDQNNPVDLEFELTVTDNDKKTNKATVGVTVSQAQSVPAPVAKAGEDQNVTSGATVNLNGGASTGADSYLWKQTAGTPTVTLTADTAAAASFTAPTVTTATPLTFELTTTNASGSTKDTVVVTVAPKVLALPVAKAGDDQNVASGATVNLSGSASTGADTYAWAQTAGTSVTLSSTNTAATSFKAPTVTQATQLTFELTTTNTAGPSKDTVTVSVSPAVVGALTAELGLPVGDIDINDPANPVVKNITGGTAPYSVTYDWGDGQTSEPKALDAGKNTDTGEHFYAADGSYNVKVTVTDAVNAKVELPGSIKATSSVAECK
ncbi:MAG: hypothetical protein ABL919_16150 [Methylococcales bacterium]|nr:hypothetical protein [Methylococcaceae bacterium]